MSSKSPLAPSTLLRTLLELGLVIGLVALGWNHFESRLQALDWRHRVWVQLASAGLPVLLLGMWRARILPGRAWGFSSDQLTRARLSVLLCLAGGALLTVLLVEKQLTDMEQLGRARFDAQVRLLRDELQQRFSSTLQGMRALRALYASRGSIDRGEFHRFIAARNLPVEFPGIRGFGYIERVTSGELPAFLAREQAELGADFKAKLGEGTGPHYLIRFIEPHEGNEAALGLDLARDEVRRHAVEKAIAEARPVLSGAINLVQDGQGRLGYLILLPLYRDAQTPEDAAQRSAQLAGLIHAPLVLAELLEDIEPALGNLLDFELLDPDLKGRPSQVVFDYLTEGQLPASGTLHTDVELKLLDRSLLLRAGASRSLRELVDNGQALRVGLAGLAVTSLLGTVVWLMLIGRLRAHLLATSMTRDLQASTAQAESAMRENALLMDALNRHCLVAITDTAGSFLYVNDVFCAVSGWKREELLGQNHRLINSGTHPTEFWQTMWNTILAGSNWSGQICDRDRQGRLFWLSTTISPALDSAGRVERFVSISTDISPQVRNETALQEANERLELALRGGNSGLWDWLDTHQDLMWWSPQLYEMIGHTPETMPATVANFDAMLHPDDQRDTMQALDLALRGERPYAAEFRLRRADGSYHWFHSTARVYRDASQEVHRMAGALQDINALKLNQAALQEQSERMAAIFALSPDGFAALDGEGGIVYASPHFLALCALEQAQIRGLSAERLVELLAQSRGAPAAAVLERDQSSVVLHLSLPQPCVLCLSRYTGGDGNSGMLQLRDITQQFEVDRMKSEFLATAAHELRTPMVSIFGFAELLLHREMDAERQKNYLGKIHRQCKAMMGVTTELLDIARLEARRGEDFVYENVELPQLIEATVQDFQVPDGRDPPQLQFDASQHWPVRADAGKLRQVLGNLLSNAYKYSPQGGAVEIALLRDAASGSERLVLQVRDHGIGMTAEQLGHVTERFYRADPSGHVLGTGLGMSIVKEIVELHQGRLELSSTPGEGTTVRVLLAPAPADLTPSA